MRQANAKPKSIRKQIPRSVIFSLCVHPLELSGSEFLRYLCHIKPIPSILNLFRRTNTFQIQFLHPPPFQNNRVQSCARHNFIVPLECLSSINTEKGPVNRKKLHLKADVCREHSFKYYLSFIAENMNASYCKFPFKCF